MSIFPPERTQILFPQRRSQPACASLLIALCAAMGARAMPASPSRAAPAQAAPGLEAAQILDAFHAALAAGQADRAAAALSSSALIFEEGEVQTSKAGYVADHLRGDIAYSAGVREHRLRRTSGVSGDLAWIATEARSVGSFRSKPVDRLTTESVVLRREPEGWKIIHVHWSSHAAKSHNHKP